MYATSRRSTHPTDVIARVMVWPVAIVPGEATLLEVAEALAADGIGAVGVVENGHLVGVVSERDIVHHLAQGSNPEHVTAADVMATDLVTARPSDLVLDTARRMIEAQVRHVPVIDDDTIAGFVSMRDLFEVLVDVAAHEEDVVVVPSGTRVVVRQE
jgi:CBS domain-containing protein